MISKKALEEFKQVWKKEFNEEISDEKAMEEAINLLTLMNVIYRPAKKEWVEELEKDEQTNSEEGDKDSQS